MPCKILIRQIKKFLDKYISRACDSLASEGEILQSYFEPFFFHFCSKEGGQRKCMYCEKNVCKPKCAMYGPLFSMALKMINVEAAILNRSFTSHCTCADRFPCHVWIDCHPPFCLRKWFPLQK